MTIQETWETLLKKHRLTFVTGPLTEMLDEFEALMPVESEYIDPSLLTDDVKDYHRMYFKDKTGAIVTLLFHVNGEIASMKSENRHILSYLSLLSFVKWYETEVKEEVVRTLDDFMNDLHVWMAETREKGGE